MSFDEEVQAKHTIQSKSFCLLFIFLLWGYIWKNVKRKYYPKATNMWDYTVQFS